MRSLTLHLKVLITLLVSLGVLITAYQIFIQGIPITGNLWHPAPTLTQWYFDRAQ